jgi:DNA-directed RNA polymerase beta subunit
VDESQFLTDSNGPLMAHGGYFLGCCEKRNHQQVPQERPLSFAALVRKNHRYAHSPGSARVADRELVRLAASVTTSGRQRVQAAKVWPRAAPIFASQQSGLDEIFEEISPDRGLLRRDHVSCRSRGHRARSRPSIPIEECKERGHDLLAAPRCIVNAEFMNHLTGEIKTQTVFMGDFPLMTRKGHVHHQRHRAGGRFPASSSVRRVCTSTVRSPRRLSDKDIYSARIIPSRGAWLEFEIDKRDQVGVRIDRKRKQSVTVFLKALGLTSEQILEEFKNFPSIAHSPWRRTPSSPRKRH